MPPKPQAQKAIISSIGYSTSLTPYINRSDMILVKWLMESNSDKFQGLTEEQVRKSFYRAKKKYIKIKTVKQTDKGAQIEICLTREGKKLFNAYSFEDVYIKKQEKWDGKWRVIVFDIPKKYKRGRDVLRDKLRNMGFFQIQKSVWAHPYECEKEIDYILDLLGLEKFVMVMESNIDKDSTLKSYFRKKGYDIEN